MVRVESLSKPLFCHNWKHNSASSRIVEYGKNSTQLNFIYETVKTNTDMVVKNKHKLSYNKTDTTIKATYIFKKKT